MPRGPSLRAARGHHDEAHAGPSIAARMARAAPSGSFAPDHRADHRHARGAGDHHRRRALRIDPADRHRRQAARAGETCERHRADRAPRVELARRLEHRADPHVVGVAREPDLELAPDARADDEPGRHEAPHRRRGNVVRSHVHTRGARGHRDVQPVVHHHRHGAGECRHERARHFHHRPCVRIFEPQLDHRRAAARRRLCALHQPRRAVAQIVGDRHQLEQLRVHHSAPP